VSQQTTNHSFDELARAMVEGSLSRRRALKLIAGTALAALIPSQALAGDDDDDCVRICHVPFDRVTGECDFANARTRCVSRRERRRHLNRHPCDCRGRCSASANCGGSPPPALNRTFCSCNDGEERSECIETSCLDLSDPDIEQICAPLCATHGGFSGSAICQSAGCACQDANGCPQPDNQCQQASCTNGVCGVENLPDDTPCNLDDNVCTIDVCTAGVCVSTQGCDGDPCTTNDDCCECTICVAGECH
jgi:hypothetical protein